MLTTGIQNPPEPQARAQAAYHGSGHLIGIVSTHFQRPRRPSGSRP